MSVIMTELTLTPGQEPVGNGKFTVELDLAFDAVDNVRTGTVTFWCMAAFSVTPQKETVTIPAGATSARHTCALSLSGALPTVGSIVRLFAECDERHSVYVKVT